MSIKADSVFITGLDSSIREEEIRKEIFPDVPIILVSIVCDEHGRSTGNAVIRFASEQAAKDVQREFDNAQVDGKVMSVQLIGKETVPRRVVKQATSVAKVAPVPTRTNQAQRRAPVAQQQQRRAPVAAQAQRRAPVAQQQQQRRAPVAQRGAPVAQRRPQQRLPSLSPRRGAAAPGAPAAQQRRAPVAPRRGGVVQKKPVAGKRVAAAPKKSVSAADLDAQLDKYNASRKE